MDMKAYMNRILRVNLSTGAITTEKLVEDYLVRYLGGEGYGMALLWNEVPPDVGPLDPENVLSFNTGPLTATPTPSSSRTAICAISPETNTIGASSIGSHWGAELKFAGYDTVAFAGKADHPVYLYIDNDTVELRDASAYWGTTTREAQEAIKADIGEQFRVICIGQAGENIDYLAAVCSEDCFAGRGGMGAIMGDKNLKAIAVHGTKSVEIADKDAFLSAFAAACDDIRGEEFTWGPLHGYGTPSWTSGCNDAGTFPTRNFQDNASPHESALNMLPDRLWNDKKRFKVKRHACYGCQIGCHKDVEMGDIDVGEIEYETVGAFGGRCALDDFGPICMCNYYCSIYGLDTISVGTTVGMAMELYERGILTKDQLDGLDLHFGNGEAAAELVRKMGLREGCGDLFADGCDVAVEKIGAEAKQYAMTCKGMELSASDPRASTGMVVSFGTSERGACHMRPYAATCDALGYNFEDIGIDEVPDPLDDHGDKKWVKSLKEIFVATNLVGICDFDVINCELKATTLAAVYSAATGRTIDREELLRAAERTIALERAINFERGFRRADDLLPERFSKEPAKYGKSKGRVIENDAALDGYYEVCDYDPDLAIPTRDKYAKLGMEDIAQRVYAG